MDKLVYNLDEVAKLTGFSRVELLRDCKAGRVKHVHRGRFYGLTLPQIHELIVHHTRGTAAAPVTEDDELEEARAMTAQRIGGAA